MNCQPHSRTGLNRCDLRAISTVDMDAMTRDMSTMPSPMNEKCVLPAPPVDTTMPAKPMTQPATLRAVRRSILKMTLEMRSAMNTLRPWSSELLTPEACA